MIVAGTRLGPYQILAPLGAGGMGEVYRARHCRLEREVAIKVLPEPFAQDPDRLARFEREAKAVAALSHPNLVVIHDFGTEQGICFAVMELLEGETLRCLLARSRLRWRKAVKIGLGLAEGLAAAHAKGIIHRDLKPENLFLVTQGGVKILDFGLARMDSKGAAEAEPASHPPSPASAASVWQPSPPPAEAGPSHPAQTGPYVPAGEDPSGPGRTDVGVVMGTVGYMSPEQARGLAADARSDLFALGCVLYEMLIGQRAFLRATAAETLAAIINDDPPEFTDAIRKKIPPEVEGLIRRCLKKDPAQRVQSAHELALALRATWRRPSPAPSSSPRRPGTGAEEARRQAIESLAVLPLANAGGDPNTEYLSEGITDGLIAKLSQLPGLRVMAHSTVFRYKSGDVDPQEVGRILNVRAVLTGRLRQRGDRLTITTELVDVADGSRIWGEQYDRNLLDVFAVQEAIAKGTADRLRLRLTADQEKRLRQRHTENTEAYQCYVKGRHYWNKRTPEDIKQGIQCFQRAIDQDPLYAAAYAGLADSYSTLGLLESFSPSETMPKARLAAVKALEMDDGLAEAHASLAVVRWSFDWDWPEAEREFQRAVELNPGYAMAHHWYGWFLATGGRFDAAKVEMKRAQELDPLALVTNTGVGVPFLFARQYDEAIDVFRGLLELEPGFYFTRLFLGIAYEQKAMYQEAIRELNRARQLADRPLTLAALGHVCAVSGETVEARQILDELHERSKKGYVSPYAVALIYAGLNEHDRALAWLQKACDNRALWLIQLRVDPRLDGLRWDRRFADLLRRMSFPP